MWGAKVEMCDEMEYLAEIIFCFWSWKAWIMTIASNKIIEEWNPHLRSGRE